jgi:acyl-CoA thioesterase
VELTGEIDFAAQMAALEPAGPGRYTVDVSPAWNCPVVPQGGVMSAVAVNAMSRELAAGNGSEAPRLRSLTTVFSAPVPAGPVTVGVTVLRRGRSMAQVMADVRAPGADAGHTTVAVFGATRPGFEFTDLVMPDVPPPDECPSFRDEAPDEWVALHGERPVFAYWEMVEGRAALGHAPWEDYVPTTSEHADWYRYDLPPFRPDGTLDPLAVLPLCDTNPGAIGERMGPGTPWFMPPSADLTVHLLGEARSEWLLGVHRAHHAGDGYTSLSAELWDPATGLIAHIAQVALLVFPDGPPDGDLRLPADQRQRQGDG